MKKRMRTALSVLLSVCILVGMMPAMAFAEVANEDEYNYVSLGASNVNGYGLRGYIKPCDGMDDNETMEEAALDYNIKANANVLGYLQAPKQSYPALIQNELMKEHSNVQLNQLAISSMRVEELRLLLDENYKGDPYSKWRFIGKGGWFDIADHETDGNYNDLSNEYIQYVKNAKLITLDIGTNNFGVYLGHALTEGKLGDDGNNIKKYLDENIGDRYNEIKNLVEKAIKTVGVDLDDIADAENLLDTFSYALIGFCYNFDKVVGKIYELNPNVTMVAVSIQNILAGVNMSIDGIKLPVGDVIGAIVNIANAYIAIGSPYCNKYYYADVRQNGHVDFFIDQIARYNGDVNTLTVDAKDCFNVYDGSPGSDYEDGYHIKYYIYNTLLKDEGDEAKKAALPKAYDAYAQYLRAAARIDAIDYKLLSMNTGSIENDLKKAVEHEIGEAVKSKGAYKLPKDFFKNIATSNSVDTSVVESVAAYNVRTTIGNSFFAHPTPAGHEEIANIILKTLKNKTKGRDLAIAEIAKGTAKAIVIREAIETLQKMMPCRHKWGKSYVVDTEPTCTVDGSKSLHCTKCGKTKNDTIIPALGHIFSEWAEDCDNAGKEYRTCSVCGLTENRSQKLEPVAKALKSGKIKFSWKKINGATKYNVYVGKHGKKLKKIATTAKTTYTVKKLVAKKNYDLRVIAYDVNGKKIKRSSVVTCKTKA